MQSNPAMTDFDPGVNGNQVSTKATNASNAGPLTPKSNTKPMTLNEAINKASQFHGCLDEYNSDHTVCNYFAAKIGELMDIPYFRCNASFDDEKPSQNELAIKNCGRLTEHVANEMYDFLKEAVQSPGSGWKLASNACEAQWWANKGKYVVGVWKMPRGHGHVGIVEQDKDVAMAKTGLLHIISSTKASQDKKGLYKGFAEPITHKEDKKQTTAPIWAIWTGQLNSRSEWTLDDSTSHIPEHNA